MTEKFYYHSPYTNKIIATILDVRQKDNDFWILTDKTIFYPGGGGQLPDRGKLAASPVLEVKEKQEKIWHRVQKDTNSFAAGQKVVLELDWQYRFYQMQQHTGQHLLSAVLNEAGWPTVSVHLGEEYTFVEVDGPLPEVAELKKVENRVQFWISQALPVQIHWITADDIERFPLRRPPKSFENLRVVEIKNLDYSACGGIHVQNIAEIGLVKIVGCEKIRGRSRIKAFIGQRALDYLEELHQTNLLLREKLKTDHLQFNERVAQIQEELSFLKRLNKFYKQYFVQYISQELAQQTKGPQIVYKLEQGEQEDAAAVAKNLSNAFQKVAFIQFDWRFFLTSPSPKIFDTIKFLKQNAESLGLKGGGSQGFCQGIMKRNNLKQIAESIKMAMDEN